MTANVYRLAELPALVGKELGVSDWVAVDQPRIDTFVRVTGAAQVDHVAPERAAADPSGMTAEHGYLTLSLLPQMAGTAYEIADVRAAVNYGLNRVRFPAPVPAGSRLRGRFELVACTPIAGGVQLTILATIERQHSSRPVCVAESLSRRYAVLPTESRNRR